MFVNYRWSTAFFIFSTRFEYLDYKTRMYVEIQDVLLFLVNIKNKKYFLKKQQHMCPTFTSVGDSELLQTLKELSWNGRGAVSGDSPQRDFSQVSALSSDLWEVPACTGSGFMWRRASRPLDAKSSGKWFAELPSDTTCWALIDSCGSVKLGTKLYTVTWHWPRPAQSCLRSACLPT